MSDDDQDEDEDDSEEEDEESDEEDDDEDETANAWASTSKTKTDDTTNILSSKIGSSYGCCHISHNNLHFLVPMRSDCKSFPPTLFRLLQPGPEPADAAIPNSY
jgi:hypothetical protein